MELIHQFQAESLDDFNMLCNDEIAKQIIINGLDNALVVEIDNKIVGVIAGIISNYPLNNEPIYQEIIWYMDKNYRRYGIRLLEALEKECKSKGIKHIIMVSTGESMRGKLDSFYSKQGFKYLETQFVKTL